MAEAGHVLPDDTQVAYHVPWRFRTAAFFLSKRDALGPALIRPSPNLYPYAGELRKWMLRQPNRLGMFERDDRSWLNPYTQHAGVLIAEYVLVTRDYAPRTLRSSPLPLRDLELRRIRLASEFVLYTARICEALIKQLLFCTTFPEGWYRKVPLDALLSRWCPACPRTGSDRHQLSLLGSLAHSYGFCGPYQHCLEKDLPWIKQLRDANAAHANTWNPVVPSSQEALIQRAKRDVSATGERFLHILQHIAHVEDRMIQELQQLSGQLVGGFWQANLVSAFHFQTRVHGLVRVLRKRARALRAPLNNP